MTMRGAVLALASRLRFPWLFALTGALFVLSLLVPDPVPLLDEILLGLATLLFGAWRRRSKAGLAPRPGSP
jgi:hypothetical protein